MAYMRSSVAFALFWVNFIVDSLNIYLTIKLGNSSNSSSSNSRSSSKYPYYPYRYDNLVENDTLLENNSNYFIKKENESLKELRNLLTEIEKENLGKQIFIVSFVPFVFIIIFSFSFCVTRNECCSSDYEDGNAICFASCCCACCIACCDCHLSGAGLGSIKGQAAAGIVYLIIFAFIIYGIYKAIQACGKNISRLIAAIGLFILNGIMAIMSIISGTGKFHIIVFVLSSFAAISNLLAMVLPNLACCHNLSYEHLYEDDDIIQANEDNSTPKQLLIVQPENEMPIEEEAYPNPEEIIHAPIDQNITPNYTDTNPGYDNDNIRFSINSLDAPAPIYMQQEDDKINLENNSYPKPQ